LQVIHNSCSDTLAIFAHAHLGHTPGLHVHASKLSTHVLSQQVSAALEAFDALRSHFGQQVNVILVGHSVGTWICLQVLGQGTYWLHKTHCALLDTQGSRRGHSRCISTDSYHISHPSNSQRPAFICDCFVVRKQLSCTDLPLALLPIPLAFRHFPCLKISLVSSQSRSVLLFL
jgi:hypothetical protein